MKATALASVAAALALAGCSHGHRASLVVSDGNPPATSETTTATKSPAASPEPTHSQVGATTGTATTGTGTTGPGTIVTATAEPPSTSTPRPTPTPSPKSGSGVIEVSNGDNGSTVHLRAGQELRVRLTPDGGNWDPPVSGDDGVAHRQSSSGGYPSNDPVDALFVGRGSGSTDITTMTDMACLHTNPRCLPPQRSWSVHVVVA